MYNIRQGNLSEQSMVLKSLWSVLRFIPALLELTFQWWERDTKNSNKHITYQVGINAKEKQSRVRQGCRDGCYFRRGGQGGLTEKGTFQQRPEVE